MSADANRVQLIYKEESSYGVVPAGNPAFDVLRYTSESLGQDTETTTSQEIRADRQVPDVVRTNINAGGDLGLELSYGAYDDFLEAALFADSTWAADTAVATADTNVSAANADSSFNHTTAWSNNPAVGEWIYVSGFATAANNGYFKVLTVSGTKITVNGTLTDEAATPSVTIKSNAGLVNGTTLKSYTIEKEYQDLSNIFEVLTGMAINGMALTVAPDAIMTGTFSFLGKAAASGAATVGDGSPNAAATNAVMNAIDHVEYISEAGSSYDVTGFNFSLNNNLRARQQVGTLGAISLGLGTVDVTGSVQAYFASSAVMDKYLNFTASSLALITQDAAGNAYIFEFPQIKYTAGRRVAGGINTDVIADMSFTAYRNASENATVRVVRFAA